MMTNLTLLELAAIAVALDEEESADIKRRRWAVHPAWSKRKIEGEFVTFTKNWLTTKWNLTGIFGWKECFSVLLEKVNPLLIKQRMRFQKPISRKERWAVSWKIMYYSNEGKSNKKVILIKHSC